MNTKMSEADAKVLYELDLKINSLYEKKAEIIKKLQKKYPTGSSVHFKNETLEKPYVRVSFTDNLKDIEEGKSVYRTAHFSRFEIKVETLKNEPKEKAVIND